MVPIGSAGKAWSIALVIGCVTFAGCADDDKGPTGSPIHPLADVYGLDLIQPPPGWAPEEMEWFFLSVPARPEGGIHLFHLSLPENVTVDLGGMYVSSFEFIPLVDHGAGHSMETWAIVQGIGSNCPFESFMPLAMCAVMGSTWRTPFFEGHGRPESDSSRGASISGEALLDPGFGSFAVGEERSTGFAVAARGDGDLGLLVRAKHIDLDAPPPEMPSAGTPVVALRSVGQGTGFSFSMVIHDDGKYQRTADASVQWATGDAIVGYNTTMDVQLANREGTDGAAGLAVMWDPGSGSTREWAYSGNLRGRSLDRSDGAPVFLLTTTPEKVDLVAEGAATTEVQARVIANDSQPPGFAIHQWDIGVPLAGFTVDL